MTSKPPGWRQRHGLSRTPEYDAWRGMISRCTKPNRRDYKYYGGRGIKFCEQWRCFVAFYADMGPRPSPDLSLDRIDNEGNYEPGNCRWATRKEQRATQRKPSELRKAA